MKAKQCLTIFLTASMASTSCTSPTGRRSMLAGPPPDPEARLTYDADGQPVIGEKTKERIRLINEREKSTAGLQVLGKAAETTALAALVGGLLWASALSNDDDDYLFNDFDNKKKRKRRHKGSKSKSAEKPITATPEAAPAENSPPPTN